MESHSAHLHADIEQLIASAAQRAAERAVAALTTDRDGAAPVRQTERLIGITDVCTTLSVSKSKIYALLRLDPAMPHPVRRHGKLLWSEREVQAYVHAMLDARGTDAGVSRFKRHGGPIEKALAAGAAKRAAKKAAKKAA